MDIRLSCKPYKQYEDEIIEFRNQNRSDYRDEIYFHWRYCERPNGREAIVVMARTDKNELIGSLSVIPHHYVVNNITRYFGVLGDISVKSEFRGKGIATEMFNFLSSSKEIAAFECIIVLPNYEAGVPLLRAEWSKVTELQRYIKVINIKFSSSESKLDYMKKMITYYAGKIIEIVFRQDDSPGYSYTVTNVLKDDIEMLWDKIDKRNVIIGHRDKTYLDWRYHQYPLIRYDYFLLYRNEEIRGYIVYHLINDHICQIDDFLCLDFMIDHPPLFKKYFEYIKNKYSISMIQLKINKNRLLNQNLIRYGFLKRDHQDVMVYCKEKNDLIMNGINWFITGSDKDV